MIFKPGKKYKLIISDPDQVSFNQTIVARHVWTTNNRHLFRVGYLPLEIHDCWFDQKSPQVRVDEIYD